MTGRSDRLRALALAALLAALSGAGVLLVAGAPIGASLRAFAGGALADRFGLGETLVVAGPLFALACSLALTFRAGVFNIGAEGQWLAGMLAATAAGTHPATARLALPAAAAAGALWAFLAAWLHLRRGVSEILSTLLLNFAALYLVGWAVQDFLREARGAYPQSDPILPDARLGALWPGSRAHVGLLLLFAVGPVVSFLLARTSFGVRLRAAGSSERAARLAAFPVERDRLAAWLLAGATAGLVGGVEVLGVTHRLYERPSSGLGYLAIGVALLGGLRPLGMLGAALLFALLDAGCAGIEQEVGVSHGLARLLQAVLLGAFLAAVGRRAWRGRAAGRGALASLIARSGRGRWTSR